MSGKITTKEIAELREITGAGIMDCKKALEEAGGNFDRAIELLRKKGARAAEKRAAREAKEGVVVSYVHSNDRIGVLLELNSETDFVAKNEEFKKLAHELALQIAAMNPKYISPEDIPVEEIENRKNIEREEMKESGKSPEIIESIINGKLNKYFSEVCLLNQPYFKDEKKTINDLINEAIGKIGEKISVGRFCRFEVGK